MVTVNFVAFGRRSAPPPPSRAGMKLAARVPAHCHVPAMAGSTVAGNGASLAATSSERIGLLKSTVISLGPFRVPFGDV
jgi:hypothetical protein